jgi:DNA-binding beta-propeller fold protein YncE
MERAAAFSRGFTLSEPAWLVVLHALCAVAEGAVVPLLPGTDTTCVAAVLGDAWRRLSTMGGRKGMPRALGSVLGSLVVRFVGGFCGKESRVIATPRVRLLNNGIAISRDGGTLLVSDCYGGSHCIHTYHVSTGEHLGTIGSRGTGPLQFCRPRQIWIASDDYVFIADSGNDRIQVLTPQLNFGGFIGVSQIQFPHGVCATTAVVVVAEFAAHRISVFARHDGALLRRFGSPGSGNSQVLNPLGLCLMSEGHVIAVVDFGNDRISVFSLTGEFIRHVGVGDLRFPLGVACSATKNEIIVADCNDRSVVMFRATGEFLQTMGHAGHRSFSGVAIHGDTIFAQTFDRDKCVVFS